MKLHNTLTRQTEQFEPLNNAEVRIYSCGPTVYDHIHIGNLSAFIYADTLRRILSAIGYRTKHVMNFTDVDDKTIRRSAEKYPGETPEDALKKLTTEYSKIFLNDMVLIGNDVSAVEFINATDHIKQMRSLISDLYNEGVAYIADDGVYFSIDAYRKNGKKYGQLTEITEASTSEARIQNDEYDKESVHDFALWKIQKSNEPAWEFELDGHNLTGRPGWHIECSAMSVAKLGQPFDIHTGGVDLIFPHHENEIAQSTALGGEIYAKYFFHNEHLMVDGKKMSKSLNNFYTLRDIQEKGYDPLAFRLMVLQSHYRSQSNFTWEALEAAQNRLRRWQSIADLRWQIDDTDETSSKVTFPIQDELIKDLDTPAALAITDGILSSIESREVDSLGQSIKTIMVLINNLFGINLEKPDITNEQKQLIHERQKARLEKNWDRSDVIRDALLEQGIALNDTDKGPIWSRI